MIKNIIFDFDGVILDSVPIKTEAYSILFKDFPNDKVKLLIKYHIENGGISRYKKVQYFFEELLNEKISETKINEYASKYSLLTKQELSNEKYLISDTVNFIKENYKQYRMHIASGADEEDLLYICQALNLNHYFYSIYGSPKVKSEIVTRILQDNNYKKEETCLVGDSVNDFEAANVNSIEFYGFNNINLLNNHAYIHSFKDFKSI